MPVEKDDAGWHLIDMDANRNAPGQAHPCEDRIDVGDPLGVWYESTTLMARAILAT
jgi:hypothetical protein